MCVKEGDAASLMCSYNIVNGVPACVRPSGDCGIFMVDCDSVEVMVSGHKYLNDTPVSAITQSLKAGVEGGRAIAEVEQVLSGL
ncbi:hypothetical protein IFM89_018725 [Coptis chinensis]|uniref:Uncharacterized protein n=1 Tax=Coptis chinensis TaxID=261450 RepID=A0A835IDA7_9MAGN|nr:hypothetical protein IFM89_018725 [Coptis chinensis]